MKECHFFKGKKPLQKFVIHSGAFVFEERSLSPVRQPREHAGVFSVFGSAALVVFSQVKRGLCLPRQRGCGSSRVPEGWVEHRL